MPYRTKTGWDVTGTSKTLTPAAGTLAGDLLLLLVNVRAGGTAGVNDALTVSAGWTLYGARVRQTVTTGGTDEVMELWWRIATGSDSVTVTKVGSDLGSPAAKLFTYKGISDATPFDVAGVASQGAAGATTQFTPSGVTPVTDGAEVLSFIGIGNATINYPGLAAAAQGFTLRDNEATAASSQAIGLADKAVSPAAAVTMPTWDGFGTPREWVAYSLALRLAPITTATVAAVASTSSVPRFAPSGATFVSVAGATVAATSAVPQPRVQTNSAALASDLGTAAAKVAGTTLSLVVTASPQPQVGDVVTVTCGRDDVASDPLPDTLTDSAGNTWLRHTSTSGAVGDSTAGDGVVLAAFSSIISVAWTGTTTLTWTHPSVVARTMVARHFKPSAGHVFDLYGTPVSGLGTNPTLTLTTPVAGGWLLIVHLAHEFDWTQLSYNGTFVGTVGGPWSAPLTAFTTGGTGASNVFALSQWKATTSPLAAATWQGSTGSGADTACVMAAYREMPTGPGPALVGISAQDEFVAPTGVPGLPLGWAPGDLLMLVIGARNEFAQGVSDAVTVIPSDWTQGPTSYRAITSDRAVSVQVWTKIAAVGEAAPLVSVGSSLSASTAGWSTQMAAFRGVNPTSIYDTGPAVASAAAALTYAAPSYNTLTADTLAVSVVASGDDDTLVASGWRTAMGDADWDSQTGADHAVGLAIAPMGAPGTSPPLTWRQINFTAPDAWVAIALTLRTAPGVSATARVAASTSTVGFGGVGVSASPATVASTSLVRAPAVVITGGQTVAFGPVAATSRVPTPVVFQRPGNDTRAGALPLSGLSGTQVGTLLHATGEAGTVYEVGWRDVWYTWPFLPAGLVTLTATDLPSGCEVAAWASPPTSAGADYTSRSFLGRVTAPPYTLNVTHPGGPLTAAVALALGGD